MGASIKAFELLDRDTSLIEKVRAHTHLFRDRLTAAGFELKGDRDHPIAPVMLYDARLAAQFADEMLKRGIYVIGFSFPVGRVVACGGIGSVDTACAACASLCPCVLRVYCECAVCTACVRVHPEHACDNV